MCAGYNQGPYLDPKISAGDFLFRAYDFHGQSNCLCVLRWRVSWRAFNLYPSSLVGNGPGFMLEVVTICQRSCFCSCFCCLPPFLDSYGCHLIPVYIFSLVLLPTPIALFFSSFSAYWPFLLTIFLQKNFQCFSLRDRFRYGFCLAVRRWQ